MSDTVGSVAVEVVPDARGWAEKLRAQIRDQKVTVKADADTAEAETQLDEVARTRTVKVKADVSQLSEGASKLDQFVGQLGLLPSLAIAGGAALIPLGAALGGVVASLAAPLAIGGGGATLFALLGGAAVAQTQKQLKAISTLQTSLNGMTKGTASYVAKQKELKAAQAALTPAQTQFASALNKVKSVFDGLLQGKNGQAVLGPISAFLGLAATILPKLEPIIGSVSHAFTEIIDSVSKSVDSKGFDHFISQIARLAGPDIRGFAQIAGNLAVGLSGLFIALDKRLSPGGSVDGLIKLSGAFAKFGQHPGKPLQDFIDYFHQIGPQVGATIGAVARAIVHIGAALAPLGPPVLHIIEGIANAIASMPVGTLTALATAAAQLVVFQKLGGFKALSFLSGKGLVGANLLSSGSNILGGTKGGALGGVLSEAGVQKVYVVNLPPGGLGGGVPGGSTGGKILAGAETGGEVAAGGSLLSRLFGGAFAPQSFITAADSGNETNPQHRQPIYLTHQQQQSMASTQFLKDFGPTADGVGGKVVPTKAALAPYGLSRNDARSLLGIPDIRSTGTAFDGLRQRAAQASQTIDQIGPHAHASLGAATRDVAKFNNTLTSIHDKRIQVIVDTANAIRSLERLQAIRIQDKSFTVYQRNQIIEQAVGPGGGIGRHNPGGSGGASGGSGGGAGQVIHSHLHLNDREIASAITPVLDAHAAADRHFANTVGGR